jgi:NADP-dependent 3-hydroxy acid dehydrogenase YdfG
MKTVYNKNVLIIGGDTNLGQSIALAFSSESANIIAFGKDREKLADIERTIGTRRKKIRTYRCDLSMRKETLRLFDDIIKYHDRIDILVFADTVATGELFEKRDPEDMVTLVNNALVSNIWFTKIVFSHMLQNNFGEIVYIPQFKPAEGSDGIIEGLCIGGSIAMFEGMRHYLKSANTDIPVIIAHYSGKEHNTDHAAAAVLNAVIKGKKNIRL